MDRGREDLQVSRNGLAWLAKFTVAARDDYATFDILKADCQDEEEELYWDQAQLDMIGCTRVRNWLQQQL